MYACNYIHVAVAAAAAGDWCIASIIHLSQRWTDVALKGARVSLWRVNTFTCLVNPKQRVGTERIRLIRACSRLVKPPALAPRRCKSS